jgi:hypothetical protein
MDASDDKKTFHKEMVEKWIDAEIYNVEKEGEMLSLLYETDVDVRAAYMNELELIIQF